MTSPTQEQIERDLSNLLRQFNGKEYSGLIGSETLFFGDLGMGSIDAVILGEALERLYMRLFPFGEFLSEISRDGIRDITLGELAAFLYRQMRAVGDESAPCR